MKKNLDKITVIILTISIILLIILAFILFNGRTVFSRQAIINFTRNNEFSIEIHKEENIEDINYIISTISDKDSDGIAVFKPSTIGYELESHMYVPKENSVVYDFYNEYYYNIVWSSNPDFSYVEITYYGEDKILDTEKYESDGDNPIIIKAPSKDKDLKYQVILYDEDGNILE